MVSKKENIRPRRYMAGVLANVSSRAREIPSALRDSGLYHTHAHAWHRARERRAQRERVLHEVHWRNKTRRAHHSYRSGRGFRRGQTIRTRQVGWTGANTMPAAAVMAGPCQTTVRTKTATTGAGCVNVEALSTWHASESGVLPHLGEPGFLVPYLVGSVGACGDGRAWKSRLTVARARTPRRLQLRDIRTGGEG